MRRSIEELVYLQLEDLGVSRERVSHLDVRIIDLITGDDASFFFIPGLERALGIRPPPEAWRQVSTVRDAVELLSQALAAAQPQVPDRG